MYFGAMNIDNEIKIKLVQRIEERDLKIQHLSKQIGTSYSTLWNFLHGQTRNFSKLPQLAKLLGFSLEDVFESENKNSIKKELQPSIVRSIADIEYGPEIISVYGHARNHSGVLVLDKTQAVNRVLSHPNQKDAARKCAAYPPDETMSPRFDLSDIAFYNEGQYPSEMQDCFVELNNGEFHLKKFLKITDKEIICRQLNPQKEWKRQRSEVKAIHAVVGRG